MKNIILASKSPRRKEILASFGFDFSVFVSDFDENSVHEDDPLLLCKSISKGKATSAAKHFSTYYPKQKNTLIIAADTIIFKDGIVFGKPSNREDAKRMLISYSGNKHNVITTLCLIDLDTGIIYEEESISRVFFKILTADELEFYLNKNEWHHAAGGYKIQGKASFFIERIEGSYSGIMGLPIDKLYNLLYKAGIMRF